jgi:hypothetical protein
MMAAKWIIRKYESNALKWEKTIPGNTSNKRVETILQRLVCQNLNADEILSSSLNAETAGRTSQLDRVGSGTLFIYGHNPYYTAEHRQAVSI